MDMPTAAELAALRKPVVGGEEVIPVGMTLLVRLEVPQEKSKGGILIPESARENAAYLASQGEVVAMGPDCYLGDAAFPNGPYCKVGDTVLFSKAEGHAIKVHGAEHRLIRDTRIMGVIRR